VAFSRTSLEIRLNYLSKQDSSSKGLCGLVIKTLRLFTTWWLSPEWIPLGRSAHCSKLCKRRFMSSLRKKDLSSLDSSSWMTHNSLNFWHSLTQTKILVCISIHFLLEPRHFIFNLLTHRSWIRRGIKPPIALVRVKVIQRMIQPILLRRLVFQALDKKAASLVSRTLEWESKASTTIKS
jgi:hypothetical protein